MNRITTAIAIATVLTAACARHETSPRSKTAADADKTYPMTATIVSRDPTKNTINLDNKEVPGQMAAMKMDYEVRGAKVSDLPPNGSPVIVTVHDLSGSYYVTDVKSKK